MQSSDLFLSHASDLCVALENDFAPIADGFLPFIDTLGVVNLVALMIVTVVCIVASALRMHTPGATVRIAREPKRWIQESNARKFVKVVRFSSLASLLQEVGSREEVVKKARLGLWISPVLSKRCVNKGCVTLLDVLNWEYATQELLSKNPMKARRARQAFIGKELWRAWNNLEGVTAADRKAVYRLAIEKAKIKLTH